MFALRTPSTRSAALALTGALVLSVIAAPSAPAAGLGDPPILSPGSVAEALATVESADPTLIRESVAEEAGTASLGLGSVTVPSDPSAGIRIDDGARTVVVDLPAAANAGPAVPLAGGGVVYPAPLSANSVVVGDLGVQMLTTIASAGAPSEYSYDVTLAPGQRLELVGDGAAIVDADGSTAVLIGEAWARDAEGDRVPTHYSVSGSTLVQTVDHTAAGVAYPVVADPLWFAPFAFKCLVGLGLNGPQIGLILTTGGPGAIGGAVARAIIACLSGK